MKFSYFSSVKSNSGIECTHDILLSATGSTTTAVLCNSILRCTDANERGLLKKRLPIITWQAYFPNGRRKNNEAVPSGLFMLDIDHVDEPNKLYYTKITSRIDELGIMVVHKTPSTKGLRIVAKCRPEFTSIAENQQWMANELGLEEFDEACNDLARASYIVPEDYFYYRDGKVFTDPMPEGVNIVAGKGQRRAVAGSMELRNHGITEATPDKGQTTGLIGQRTTDNGQQTGAVAGSQLEAQGSQLTAQVSSLMPQQDYKGIPLSDIAQKWLDNHGGMPKVGERNTMLYQLASRMKYITDFNPRTICDAIPHCDLPDDEVMALCQSACNGVRGSKIPWDLSIVIKALQTSEQKEDDKMEVNNSFVDELPPLPMGLADSVKDLPSKAVMPVLCGLMPLCMTYATNVRYIYSDGAMHRLNTMAVIYGEQGSGKSLVKDEIDLWLSPLLVADQGARADEVAYKEMKKSRKANEKLPPEPKVPIRYVPLTISCSALLKRLINSNGKHIYSFGEELDTMRKSNKAGAWSEKSDCYRLAFDNGKWGQDYVSDNSVAGLAAVTYNFSVLGTPGAVHKCFPANDAENGMCSRILFAEMIHNPFEYMTRKEKVDKTEKIDNINKAVEVLQSSYGDIELPRLAKKMERWCNDRADEARIANDSVTDTFRKRSAIIGFRCAVVYYLLENADNDDDNKVESDNMLKFAELMADYCLYHQCKLFGEEFLYKRLSEQRTYNVKPRVNYFGQLGETFTFEDVRLLRTDAHVGALRTMISRWKQDGLIEEIERNHWRKSS